MFRSLSWDHFQSIKTYICCINKVSEKTVSMEDITTLRHCENLLKVSNEMKQYVKNTIIKSH